MIVGPIAWRSNSNAVTIPKLAPAPRMPQNRSAFSSALARTSRPSAVTSSTARRQSIDSPELALQPAHPAAEGQAGDARVRNGPDVAGQADRLRSIVELAEQRAAVAAGDPSVGIDRDTAHPRQVDEHAVVAGREARHAVAAAPHGDDEVLFAGETERGDDVRGVQRPDDDAGRRSIIPFHTARAAS